VHHLELGRWDLTQLAMQPALVEPVDVFGDRDLDVVDAMPRAFVADQLGFEQTVIRLGEGVIVRIAPDPTEATASASARRSV
jgi:hypothetical protein